MRSQCEKNKEILLKKIEEYSKRPLSDSVAEHLSVYHGALKALCSLDRHWNNDGEGTKHHEYHLSHGGGSNRSSSFNVRKWMEELENSDGSTGAKWTKEQTDEIMRRSAVKCDPTEFYAAINMLYSDYGKVAHEFGVCHEPFFTKMAEAFLRDPDAVKDKLKEYWEHVVKH